MAVTSENKGLKDSFQKANVFDLSVRSELSERMENYEERRLDQFVADELLSGKGDASILQMGRRVIASAAGAIQELNLKSEEKKKQSDADAQFRAILNDLRDQLDNATEQRRAAEEGLINKYGKDFVIDMAVEFLDEKTVARRQNENDEEYEARMQQELSDLMLMPDGTIKPEYQHTEIGQWLHWRQQEQNISQKIENHLADGVIDHNELTEQSKILSVGDAHSDDQMDYKLLAEGVDVDHQAIVNTVRAIKNNHLSSNIQDVNFEKSNISSAFGSASFGQTTADADTPKLPSEPPSLASLDIMSPKS